MFIDLNRNDDIKSEVLKSSIKASIRILLQQGKSKAEAFIIAAAKHRVSVAFIKSLINID